MGINSLLTVPVSLCNSLSEVVFSFGLNDVRRVSTQCVACLKLLNSFQRKHILFVLAPLTAKIRKLPFGN